MITSVREEGKVVIKDTEDDRILAEIRQDGDQIVIVYHES